MPTRAALFLLAAAACSAPAKESAPAQPPTTTTTTQPAPTGPREPRDQPLADPSACPAIQLKAPDSLAAGTQLRVSAILVGGPASPTYKWSVSAGRIASGQGTTNLVVDTGGLAGATVTATLEIGGVNKQCATTSASTSVLIGPAS